MEDSKTIPTGFYKHDRRSGLTDPWEPLYAAASESFFSLGLFAGAPHVNSRGFVHGGLLSALADNAMGLSCARQIENIGGLVTISLSIDYLGTARQGEWLEIRAEPTRIGQSLCFAEARILSDGQLCATAKAVFKASQNKTITEERI
ncbi:PaaI family thioesterase [uncultured Halopseudomonas sp.]|uniref:PaaI family thioesterase n=1 Tax=uncultured Halopseudomonas sp. TaxID=2901193 RepID=UPI0030EC87BB|tara:strand:+ start:2209 stop:2649 length:441 start_codon:yes stop_codon:yes gene_type:complete